MLSRGLNYLVNHRYFTLCFTIPEPTWCKVSLNRNAGRGKRYKRFILQPGATFLQFVKTPESSSDILSLLMIIEVEIKSRPEATLF